MLQILPVNAQHKILKYLDFYSLIQFAHAYPNYKKIITSPVYWKNSKIFIDGFVDQLSDQKFVISNMNNYLRKMIINLKEYNTNNANELMSLVFQYGKLINYLAIDLKHYSYLIQPMCERIIYIKELNLECDDITDSHILLISNSLKLLEVFFIQSNTIINDGIEHFLLNCKHLRGFGLMLQDISQK